MSTSEGEAVLERRYWIKLLTGMIAATAIAACYPQNVLCIRDDQCADSELRPGLCIYDGETGRYCANQAPIACPSGWRWQRSAHEDLAGYCVDPALIPKDAGADTAPPADLSPADGGSD